MRRDQQEIFDSRIIETILQKSQICRLGMCHDNQPYVVPVSYGYENNHLYIHGAAVGRKVETLQVNPKVCFEIELESETALLRKGEQACNWGYQYLSLIGFGIARFLKGEEEKKHGMDVIVTHYGGSIMSYNHKSIGSLSIIEVSVESLTAKRNSQL